MTAINKIIPCSLTAPHPAAMAAAQLILMNGLKMSDMEKAWKKWNALMDEADEEEDHEGEG